MLVQKYRTLSYFHTDSCPIYTSRCIHMDYPGRRDAGEHGRTLLEGSMRTCVSSMLDMSFSGHIKWLGTGPNRRLRSCLDLRLCILLRLAKHVSNIELTYAAWTFWVWNVSDIKVLRARDEDRFWPIRRSRTQPKPRTTAVGS
jgi:hypothetical protein